MANGSAFTSANAPAPNGSQSAFIQGTGSISQTISPGAGTWAINFAYAPRLNGGGNNNSIAEIAVGRPLVVGFRTVAITVL